MKSKKELRSLYTIDLTQRDFNRLDHKHYALKEKYLTIL